MKQFRSKYLEINIKKRQHLALEFMPYGFGYEEPLFILKLFIISFYIKLPFKIKEKDSDISYGFSFNDYDEQHIFPDYLHLSWGNYNKSFDMPWHPVLFNIKYDAKVTKGSIHLKDLSSQERIFKHNGQIMTSKGESIFVKYYRETRILKCKWFNKFVDFGKKTIYVLEIEYEKPNYDLSEKGRMTDMIFLEENENVHDGFERYCKENNIKII